MRQGEIFLNPPYYSQRAVFARDPEGGFKIIIIITTTIIIKIYMFIFFIQESSSNCRNPTLVYLQAYTCAGSSQCDA